MRNNQPVQDTEYVLRDEQYLISRTDSRGRIIYANPAFIEASGFSREELVGAPHNIVRHPDMPPAAFEDLWRTNQRGESWTGMVKKRRKDGGFYWVLANVTPIVERGVTVCYASVRVKPTRAQLDAARAAYDSLRSGTARGIRLQGGQVQPTGLRGVLARLTRGRFTGVRARMLAWAVVSASFFLGAAGAAVYGLHARLSPEALAAAAVLTVGGVALIFASGWGLARSIFGLLGAATDFARQISAGNLSTPPAGVLPQDEIGELKFSLEVMRKSLVSITRDVHAGIESALTSASDIAGANADLSAHTERQAASLQEAAASMAQLASAVKQNAANAQDAHAMANRACDLARRGSRVVDEGAVAMQGIVQSSSRIAEVVGMIDGVAFQPHILALNAAVEAARAGARQVERAGASMRDIVASVQQVTRIVNQIAETSSEQHAGIDSVSRTISQRDSAAQGNAARVELASQAVENLRAHGVRLRHAIEVFRVAAASPAAVTALPSEPQTLLPAPDAAAVRRPRRLPCPGA